jgi:ribosomal 30S subunit maturation factor RimM
MIEKRKTAKNLSINFNIVKNKKRIDRLNNFEKRINDAKKANQMNENYYLKKLRITQNYINASNDERRRMKNSMKKIRRVAK